MATRKNNKTSADPENVIKAAEKIIKHAQALKDFAEEAKLALDTRNKEGKETDDKGFSYCQSAYAQYEGAAFELIEMLESMNKFSQVMRSTCGKLTGYSMDMIPDIDENYGF